MDQLHAPSSLPELLVLATGLISVFFVARSFSSRAFAASLAGMCLAAFILTGNELVPIFVAVAVGFLAVRVRRGGAVRDNPRDFLTQFGLISLLFGLYTLARIPLEGGYDQAHSNAMSVIEFEKALGLYFEPSVQEALVGHSGFMRILHVTYSQVFLAFVSSALVFLYCADQPNFKLLRDSLGASACLTLVLIAAFPTAPPRLVPESALIDSYTLLGKTHQFANQYAAVPSNHVGWMAVTGFVLGRSAFGRWGGFVGLFTAAGMTLTVITSGNHYWVDIAAGVAIAVGPAILMLYTPPSLPGIQRWTRDRGQRVRPAVATSAKSIFAVGTLGAILAWLVIRQLASPGFTDFWGYLVFQAAATLVLLLVAERVFRKQGGVSWQTYILAIVCTYADVIGTAGDLYQHVGWYDKFTHFLGVAAVTSGALDCLIGVERKAGPRWYTRPSMAFAIGVTLGVTWEIYEWMGDAVFHTARVQSNVDTARDLVFDTLGALTAVVLRNWPSSLRAPTLIEPSSLEPEVVLNEEGSSSF